MTPSEIKQLTPDGYGGDFEMTTGGKPMTNFNERLDEILERHGMYAVLKDENRFDDAAMEREFPTEAGPDKTEQALTSLIKELVAEAKPESQSWDGLEPVVQIALSARRKAIDEFEQNLLKELEEL